jgi:purine-binding chemotaxis protein CheW
VEQHTAAIAGAEQGSGRSKLVSFMLAGKEYAVDIAAISEIIYHRPVTPLPEAPQFIEGVIDLRGEIIPVMDLRKRLHFEAGGQPEHILVVRRGAALRGVIVDHVIEVLQLEPGALQRPQEAIEGAARDYILGVSRAHDRLVLVLALDELWGER